MIVNKNEQQITILSEIEYGGWSTKRDAEQRVAIRDINEGDQRTWEGGEFPRGRNSFVSILGGYDKN